MWLSLVLKCAAGLTSPAAGLRDVEGMQPAPLPSTPSQLMSSDAARRESHKRKSHYA